MSGERFGLREWAALAVGLGLAIGIRAWFLPAPGLAGDDDGFLRWVRFIGNAGLARAYDQPISFPPVIPWIWWLLGSVAPGIRSQVEQDPQALSLLKLPAVLADFGMAAIVGWSLRSRPRWAVAGVVAILLVPAVWYVSSWWGQLESLYVLPMLVAWFLVTRGHLSWAAVAIGVGLMAKPQALPLAVPFAGYYLSRAGLVGSIRGALIAAATVVALWLPFIPWNGPAHYLTALGTYTGQFSFLSLRAWNPWWILQESAAGDRLVTDTITIAGPLTLRWVGILVAGLVEVAVFVSVWRRPSAAGLAWGLAAAALAAFVALTTMHERYSYPVLIFLILAWPNRLAIGTWLLLAVTVSLNLIAAVPPGYYGPGSVIPVGGLLGLAGSVAMTVALVAVLWGLRHVPPDSPPSAAATSGAPPGAPALSPPPAA